MRTDYRIAKRAKCHHEHRATDMVIGICAGHFLFERGNQRLHRLADRLQMFKISRQRNPGGELPRPALVERIEHLINHQTRRAFILADLLHGFVNCRGQIADH